MINIGSIKKFIEEKKAKGESFSNSEKSILSSLTPHFIDLAETVLNAIQNYECDSECECCLNNKAIFEELKEKTKNWSSK